MTEGWHHSSAASILFKSRTSNREGEPSCTTALIYLPLRQLFRGGNTGFPPSYCLDFMTSNLGSSKACDQSLDDGHQNSVPKVGKGYFFACSDAKTLFSVKQKFSIFLPVTITNDFSM